MKEVLMRTVLPALIVMIAACNQIENNTNVSRDSTISNAEASNSTKPVTTDFTKDSVFTIQFPADSGSITVSGNMKGVNNPVTVNIPVSKGNLLTVVLIPEDSTANLRINQIFTPDGKADGPFGRSLSRKITQKGNYKLVIAENLMQGDEWKGKFRLTVKVE